MPPARLSPPPHQRSDRRPRRKRRRHRRRAGRDTLKQAAADGTIARTLDRAGLWRAQTPQAFRFDEILAAHRRAAAAGRSDFTDDAALAEWAGLPVKLVASSARNIKLTTADDIALAERLLLPAAADFEPRTGTGFDVHRFAPAITCGCAA